MRLQPPLDRDILHVTHARHLSSILTDGGLSADAIVGDRLQYEIGDRGIKADRRAREVTCGPGGHPSDYVPFYFVPRSPMLYKIAVGGVPHYQDGQDSLLYFRSTIGDVVSAGLPWVFSNGNCGAILTEYFDDITLLDDKIDWPLQYAKMWNSTADDPTRATRRAAEFLVHSVMPWGLVREVVARTVEVGEFARRLLAVSGCTLPVTVRPDWYYQGSRFR